MARTAKKSPPADPAADNLEETEKLFVENGRAAWFGFLSTHTQVVRRLDALLAAAHGMTLNEYEVLLKLHLAGGSMRMSDLAEAAMLSRSGLTRIVDELESEDLVQRVTAEHDGRVLIASLTRKGRNKFKVARDAHIANVHELFLNPLSTTQRTQLKRIWSTIDEALPDEADQPRTARAARSRARRRATAGSR